MQVFLAVGSLGATHEEAHLRNLREVSGSGREGKGMEAEWKKEREHHLQKNNTMDVRETVGWTQKTPDLAILDERERHHTGTLTTDRNTGRQTDGS